MDNNWRDRFQAAFQNHAGFFGGAASNFSLSIDHIVLKGGAKVPLQRGGVTAIVGANNAGKSTLLRESMQRLLRQPYEPQPHNLLVDHLELTRTGNSADLIDWVGENSTFVNQANNVGFQRASTGTLQPDMLTNNWGATDDSLGFLYGHVVFYGDAQGRFNIGGSAELRDSPLEPPMHPVHHLQDQRELFDRVNSTVQTIFGTPITLDTLTRTVRIRLGTITSEAPRVDQVTMEYRAEMAALRPLDEQGDGMRSLLGQLLPLVTSSYKIVFLDEPEAFLHPPQAQALGREIGALATQTGLQVVAATHDRNFLAGLLESEVDVSVVRLSRGPSGAKASLLDSTQLRELWTDPVLKYTNVLDGLFHKLVIAAEAEGDCAYLAAALEFSGRGSDPVPRNEVLFVPTGGKAGMAKVCTALRLVDVPVIAAPDLDVLSDSTLVDKLVKSLGSTFSPEMKSLWQKATESIRTAGGPAKVSHVLDAINSVLHPHRDDDYTSDHKDQVQAQMRTSGSKWGPVKDYGVLAFKNESRINVEALLRQLDEIGLVLVREGELERLAPEVPNRKGPGWLAAALRDGHQNNAATQAHLDRIMRAGKNQLSAS